MILIAFNALRPLGQKWRNAARRIQVRIFERWSTHENSVRADQSLRTYREWFVRPQWAVLVRNSPLILLASSTFWPAWESIERTLRSDRRTFFFLRLFFLRVAVDVSAFRLLDLDRSFVQRFVLPFHVFLDLLTYICVLECQGVQLSVRVRTLTRTGRFLTTPLGAYRPELCDTLVFEEVLRAFIMTAFFSSVDITCDMLAHTQTTYASEN